MARMCTGWMSLCVALVCLSASAQEHGTAKHYYQLKFTIGAHESEPAQDYILNVPVEPGKPGMAELNIASGAMDDMPGRVQQALEASDVEETASGLKARVQYVSESQNPPLPGINEPIVSKVQFEQQVDLPLGKRTKITQEAKVFALGGNGKQPAALPAPPPQIYLTVEKM